MRVISLSLIQARVQFCLRARHFGVLYHVTTYFFLTQEYFYINNVYGIYHVTYYNVYLVILKSQLIPFYTLTKFIYVCRNPHNGTGLCI